jgi:hypothetical protein
VNQSWQRSRFGGGRTINPRPAVEMAAVVVRIKSPIGRTRTPITHFRRLRLASAGAE